MGLGSIYLVFSRSQLSRRDTEDQSRVGGRMVGESRVDKRDEVISVFGLLQPAKGHLGTRNVLFGVLEVFKLYGFVLVSPLRHGNIESSSFSSSTHQSTFFPCNTFLFICIGVAEAVNLASLSPKETV